MNVRIFLSLAVLLIVAACSNQVGNNVKFNAENGKALVLMGVNFSGQTDPSIRFEQFDPETGRVLGKGISVKASLEAYSKDKKAFAFFSDVTPEGEHVMAFEVPAGSWFLSSTRSSSNTGYMQTTINKTSFSRGTIAFDAKPGDILYVGHFVTVGGLRRTTPDVAAAQAKLDRMPKVVGELQVIVPRLVSFSCGQARSLIGLKVQGCKALEVSPLVPQPTQVGNPRVSRKIGG